MTKSDNETSTRKKNIIHIALACLASVGGLLVYPLFSSYGDTLSTSAAQISGQPKEEKETIVKVSKPKPLKVAAVAVTKQEDRIDPQVRSLSLQLEEMQPVVANWQANNWGKVEQQLQGLFQWRDRPYEKFLQTLQEHENSRAEDWWQSCQELRKFIDKVKNRESLLHYENLQRLSTSWNKRPEGNIEKVEEYFKHWKAVVTDLENLTEESHDLLSLSTEQEAILQQIGNCERTESFHFKNPATVLSMLAVYQQYKTLLENTPHESSK